MALTVVALRGFTLVELLIVIAIIGLLLQLTLPAVEMARESARGATCQNNLRQTAMAFQLHHGAQGHFPSGGWGFTWAPDPDGGSGKKQPGAWAYSLLPYCEQQQLHRLGAGASEADKRGANRRRIETPVAIYYCPSRRLPRAYRINTGIPHSLEPKGSDPLEVGGRIDYAANGGGKGYRYWKAGPETIAEADRYEFFDPADGFGVVYPRSEITFAQLVDGSSNTYLAGEKSLDTRRYTDGLSLGDDQGPFVSDDRDSVRYAGPGYALTPAQDAEEDNTTAFGSAHPSGFFMSFCDGSVQRIHYDVDSEVHAARANIAE
ncbi:DUF1559 domain-containing protein [Lacipirellula parvula]|uniref:DUF1559 domain-containing protein n=1 Tax=Lacipirellula parvula TaxID=2650471 RepID=A0A5K7XGJ7_9BACT|nr:DUF1559 domain-containing protein [Lacipirellula parvula]BBO35578.1 hypothetical protein PLANPX_5190 [Lacipirellula parvula]